MIDLVEQRHRMGMALALGLLQQVKHLRWLRALANQQQGLIELSLAAPIQLRTAIEQRLGKFVAVFVADRNQNLRLHQVILVQQPFGTTLVAPVAVAGLSGAAAEGQ